MSRKDAAAHVADPGAVGGHQRARDAEGLDIGGIGSGLLGQQLGQARRVAVHDLALARGQRGTGGGGPPPPPSSGRAFPFLPTRRRPPPPSPPDPDYSTPRPPAPPPIP